MNSSEPRHLRTTRYLIAYESLPPRCGRDLKVKHIVVVLTVATRIVICADDFVRVWIKHVCI
jgi:hypothetical protein